MTVRRSLIVKTFPLLIVLLCAVGAAVVRAQDKTVYMVCTWDTSSIFKDKAGKEKFERRFYVSPTVTMSAADFLKADSKSGRVEGICGDYLEKTVMKAAVERGERLDPGGQLKLIRSIELSGEDVGSKNPYNFASKESVEKKRDAGIKEMIDAGRLQMKFNWDVSGKSEADDYAAETKRTLPTPGAKP